MAVYSTRSVRYHGTYPEKDSVQGVVGDGYSRYDGGPTKQVAHGWPRNRSEEKSGDRRTVDGRVKVGVSSACLELQRCGGGGCAKRQDEHSRRETCCPRGVSGVLWLSCDRKCAGIGQPSGLAAL